MRGSDAKQQRILISGLGRSGTSWLLKIFDHHPRVRTSYEPERFVPAPSEHICRQNEAVVRDYVDALFSARHLRSVRRRPTVRKSFHSAPAHYTRLGIIYALSAIERLLPPFETFCRGVPVPELADLRSAPRVVKSVAHHRLLPHIRAHAPDVKIIFLMRHPCASVYSNLRGQGSQKMPRVRLPQRSAMAAVYDGDHLPREEDLSQTEILAYRWAVTSHCAVSALVEHERAKIVQYETLCANPIDEARSIFEWAGLNWHDDSAAFLRRSLETTEGGGGYHDVVRNPSIAADRWRDQMPADEIETVVRICRPSQAFAFYA